MKQKGETQSVAPHSRPVRDRPAVTPAVPWETCRMLLSACLPYEHFRESIQQAYLLPVCVAPGPGRCTCKGDLANGILDFRYAFCEACSARMLESNSDAQCIDMALPTLPAAPMTTIGGSVCRGKTRTKSVTHMLRQVLSAEHKLQANVKHCQVNTVSVGILRWQCASSRKLHRSAAK